MFNPLLIKEIRTRMRGKTIFIIENIYLLILLAVQVFFIRFFMDIIDFGWEAGRNIFQVIIFVQAIVLTVTIPPIVASSITLEKEQKTYDMLLTTPLTYWQIISNKIFAAVSYFLVLLFLSIPMVAIVFILGGVSSKQMFFSFLVTFDALLLAGMLGMYCSTIFNRTISSVPISMIIILVLLGAVAIVGSIFPAIRMLNPFSAINKILWEWNIGFYSKQIPFWVPHLVLTILLFGWIFFSCVEQIKFDRKRNMIPARISLWLVLLGLFIFSAGSSNFFTEDLKIIYKQVNSLILLFFSLCVLSAVLLGGASLSTRDFEELRRKRPRIRAFFHKIFGGYQPFAPAFTLLVSISASLIIILTLPKFKIIEAPTKKGIMIGLMFISSSLMICLFTQIWRAIPNIKSRTLPQTLGLLLALFLILTPKIVSNNYSEKENPIEILVLLNPILTVESVFSPEQTAENYPYCKRVLGAVPMELAPSLLYLTLSLIFFLIHRHQKEQMKRYSRVELFYLKTPDLNTS